MEILKNKHFFIRTRPFAITHTLSKLHIYFNIHVCPSLMGWCQRLWRPVPLPIPAVVSKDITNTSCLVCVKNRKYTFLDTLRPLPGVQEVRRNRATCITLLGKVKPGFFYKNLLQ